MSKPQTRGILERLKANEIIVGDGGMTYELEKRGYVKAGDWTPECVVEDPEAVRQLHREFLRAGADVIQAFTFSMQDDLSGEQAKYGVQKINQAACDLAREVAREGGALFSGSVCQTGTMYCDGAGEEAVKNKFREQIQILLKNDVDLIIGEFFFYVEEAVWAVEVLRTTGKPVAITLCIGPNGDRAGVPTGECAVKLAKAGADIVGINCKFDPDTCLETVRLMKESLEKEGLKPHLMIQPFGYRAPEVDILRFQSLKESPFALEPRLLTRWDVHKFARKAYSLGVRYIGGCCGFQPYHIRAIAEELASERGHLPVASTKHAPWGGGLRNHAQPFMRAKANREYWENLEPATGRPFSPAFSKP